jgi:hypothetical protein
MQDIRHMDMQEFHTNERMHTMKKVFVISALLISMASVSLAQGIRRAPIQQTIASSYAVTKIVGTIMNVPEPGTYSKKTGYMPNILVTTDTTNVNNTIRIHFFSDTTGFGTITPGASFVMTDTMSNNWRGDVVVNITSNGTPGTTGWGFGSTLAFLPYGTAVGTVRYALAVSEAACTFNYPTGILRVLFTYDDYQ